MDIIKVIYILLLILNSILIIINEKKFKNKKIYVLNMTFLFVAIALFVIDIIINR